MLFKKSKQFTKYLGYYCKKVCCTDLLKSPNLVILFLSVTRFVINLLIEANYITLSSILFFLIAIPGLFLFSFLFFKNNFKEKFYTSAGFKLGSAVRKQAILPHDHRHKSAALDKMIFYVMLNKLERLGTKCTSLLKELD